MIEKLVKDIFVCIAENKEKQKRELFNDLLRNAKAIDEKINSFDGKITEVEKNVKELERVS